MGENTGTLIYNPYTNEQNFIHFQCLDTLNMMKPVQIPLYQNVIAAGNPFTNPS